MSSRFLAICFVLWINEENLDRPPRGFLGQPQGSISPSKRPEYQISTSMDLSSNSTDAFSVGSGEEEQAKTINNINDMKFSLHHQEL